MENQYLSAAVGLPLTQCLAELVTKQPNDPIEWIAHWLYRYMDNEIYFYEKSIYLKDLHRMQLELERERALRQKNINALNAKIKSIKLEVGETITAMGDLLREKEAKLGISPSKKSLFGLKSDGMNAAFPFRGIGANGLPPGFTIGPDRTIIGPDSVPIPFGGIGPDSLPIGFTLGPDGSIIGPNGESFPFGSTGPDGLPIGFLRDSNSNIIGPDGKIYPADSIGPDSLPFGFSRDSKGNLIGPDNMRYSVGSLPPGYMRGSDGSVTGPDGKPVLSTTVFEKGGEGAFKGELDSTTKFGRKGIEDINRDIAELKRLGLITSDMDLDLLNDPEALKKFLKLKELMNLGINLTDEEREYFLNNPDKLAEFLKMAKSAGFSTWSLDCNIGLICNHSVLGVLRGKAPYVPPETPDWWQRQGFVDQNLYDHELFTGILPVHMRSEFLFHQSSESEIDNEQSETN